MEAVEELQSYKDAILAVRDSIISLNKYKGNTYYRKQLETGLAELNRARLFFMMKVQKTKKESLIEKSKTVDENVTFVLSDAKNEEKLEKISSLERYWPELEIVFEDLKFGYKSFDVPDEIPMTEYRLDLEEAIKDFDNGCYISALVLCRRAYEGALVAQYISKTGKEPVEEVKCKHCKNTIKEKMYMGIAKLHDWAIENHLITDRLKQVGFLLSDMGTGAAHPPLKDFPRDKEMARLGITATIMLLKELHSNSQ